MGIEATGDPLWFDGLSVVQQDAVLGMLQADSEDYASRSAPKPTVQPKPPTPEGSDPDAWDRLLSIPGVRVGGR